MASKRVQKIIRSLQQKKQRELQAAFLAEGPKVVGDLLAEGYRARMLVATEGFIEANADNLLKASSVTQQHPEIVVVSEDELASLSLLKHPQQVMAVFDMPQADATTEKQYDGSTLALALDGVQDPGNLGTIIRIADWFGIGQLFCSPDTADCYNPKVVQATMGSLARVHISYCQLDHLIENLPPDVPIYGTLLDGNNIYEADLQKGGLLVMGNEGNGISPELRQRVTHRLLIPPYPGYRQTAESLNVATATAICCAEFRRRITTFHTK